MTCITKSCMEELCFVNNEVSTDVGLEYIRSSIGAGIFRSYFEPRNW